MLSWTAYILVEITEGPLKAANDKIHQCKVWCIRGNEILNKALG